MNPRPVPVHLWLPPASLAAVLLWWGIGPTEWGTWWLEVAPVLGTQDDGWDPQWDMFPALAGSVAARLALSRLHQGQLDQLSLPPV